MGRMLRVSDHDHHRILALAKESGICPADAITHLLDRHAPPQEEPMPPLASQERELRRLRRILNTPAYQPFLDGSRPRRPTSPPGKTSTPTRPKPPTTGTPCWPGYKRRPASPTRPATTSTPCTTPSAPPPSSITGTPPSQPTKPTQKRRSKTRPAPRRDQSLVTTATARFATSHEGMRELHAGREPWAGPASWMSPWSTSKPQLPVVRRLHP